MGNTKITPIKDVVTSPQLDRVAVALNNKIKSVAVFSAIYVKDDDCTEEEILAAINAE